MMRLIALLVTAWVLSAVGRAVASASAQVPVVSPATDLRQIPASRYASPEARAQWDARSRFAEAWIRWRSSPEAVARGLDPVRLRAHWLRQWAATDYLPPLAAKQAARYNVRIAPGRLGGVAVETFTPMEGVKPGKGDRVLINLHGGAFVAGAGVGGRVESIPIAAVAGMTVVSVDYRQAPEHAYPAASEDVAAVYRALLKRYRPEHIGLFGCSSGGMLVAQSVAWFAKVGLPRPGAVAMLCGAGEMLGTGDGAFFAAALDGVPLDRAEQRQEDNLYLRGADPSDPALFPMRHPDTLKRFPPSLLLSATRAYELSSVSAAHRQLALAGVDAELYLWDGVYHGFLYDPDLPESREAYALVARFFERRLGVTQ